jgi:hypothetical protein
MKTFIPHEIVQISDLLEDIQASQWPCSPDKVRIKWNRYNPDTHDYEIGISGDMHSTVRFITEQIRLRNIQGACFTVSQHPETREHMSFNVFAFRLGDLKPLQKIARDKIEADKAEALREERIEVEKFNHASSAIGLKEIFRLPKNIARRSASQIAHETNIALVLLGRDIDSNTQWAIEKVLPKIPESLKPRLTQIKSRIAKEFIKKRALESEVAKWDVMRAFSKAASNESVVDTFKLKENMDERTPRDLIKESCLAAFLIGVSAQGIPADIKSEITAGTKGIKKILSASVLNRVERQGLMKDAGKKFIESRKLSGTMQELKLI